MPIMLIYSAAALRHHEAPLYAKREAMICYDKNECAARDIAGEAEASATASADMRVQESAAVPQARGAV